jgi:molecular chaperone Hsp33
MTDATAFPDLIQPFRIENLGVRGRLVRLGPAVSSILGPHGYPDPVARLMGEMLALTAVLASALKFDGVFKVQVQGDGPLSLMVADITSGGDLRGYARYDAGGVAAAGDVAGAPVPRLLGAGRLAVTVDHGANAQQHQGMTELTGRSLADCAHTYFRQSESLETAIVLAAAPGGGAARAAALMVQRPRSGDGADWTGDGDLPDDPEDDWRRAVVLTSSVTTAELLDGALPQAHLLYRMYHEDGVRLFRPRPVRHACRCSRAKVAAALGRFPATDLDSMVEDGRITVTCEFCKTEYRFSREALANLPTT